MSVRANFTCVWIVSASLTPNECATLKAESLSSFCYNYVFKMHEFSYCHRIAFRYFIMSQYTKMENIIFLFILWFLEVDLLHYRQLIHWNGRLSVSSQFCWCSLLEILFFLKVAHSFPFSIFLLFQFCKGFLESIRFCTRRLSGMFTVHHIGAHCNQRV